MARRSASTGRSAWDRNNRASSGVLERAVALVQSDLGHPEMPAQSRQIGAVIAGGLLELGDGRALVRAERVAGGLEALTGAAQLTAARLSPIVALIKLQQL